MTERDDKQAKVTKAFEELLRAFNKSPGSNPELLDTPVRASNMWLNDLINGYDWQPEEILSETTPIKEGQGLVVVRDLFIHSICPHHLMPVHGYAHVAYIPGASTVGVSQIVRLLECFAHRLTTQEQICSNVVNALMTHISADGAACILDMEQLCMVARGVRKPGSRVTTSSYDGKMITNPNCRIEFLNMIGAEE